MHEKKRLNVIAFFLTSSQTMGGDSRIMIELIKQCIARDAFAHIRIFTTKQGAELCQKNGIEPSGTVEYCVVPFAVTVRHGIFEHIRLTRAAKKYIGEKDFNDRDILYSRSHFWPEIFSVLSLKRKKHLTWLMTMFLFYPLPWKGFLHSYDTTYVVPSLGDTWKFIYSQISFFFIRRHGDIFLITNKDDAIHLEKHGISTKKILPVYGGLHLAEANSVPQSEPVYDGVFVGRLHPQKGIEPLIRVWRYIVEKKPEAKMALIGVGEEKYTNDMKQLAKELGLEKSIDWLGYVDGKDKYAVLKKSRVFLHSTVYDNNGMAAAEALAAGVPVVRFDLPPLHHVYQQGCAVAVKGDLGHFAGQVLFFLDNPKEYKKAKLEALEAAKTWDWQHKGEQFIRFLQENHIA